MRGRFALAVLAAAAVSVAGVGQAGADPHTPATSFLAASGPTGGDSAFVPPETAGSVGPSQVLVAVNGRIKVFDRTGAVGGLNTTLDDFFASVQTGGTTYPQVEYDRLSGRWFVAAIDVGACPNKILLAVSDGPTVTGGSSFDFFSFTGRAGFFTDYLTLGVDAHALYVGGNMFDVTTVGCPAPSSVNASAFVIDKADLIGGTLNVTSFHDLVGASTGEWSPQGVQNMDPGATAGYFAGIDFFNLGQLVLRRVSDPGGTPTLSGPINVAVSATASPIAVPQPAPGPPLAGLDDRLNSAMIARNAITGVPTLWAAHQIQVNASGAASASGGRNGTRWYELGSLSGTPGVVQSGTLFDPGSTNPLSYWVGSIATSGQGHASLNSSVAGAGASGHAGVAASGRLRADAPGTTRPATAAQTSTFGYDTFVSGTERWGDYSQTVVDPNDDMTFWTFQEYVTAANRWGVRVIELRPPPPATPMSTSPAIVPAGQASTSVEIVGQSAAGTEFFDPGPDTGGPGFANRIGATVSGGVSVNGATFTDPTHVTLDLDTTGAGGGTKTVTITNPDGQTASAALLQVVAGPARTLTVQRAGTGAGTVSGTGISCGSDCTEIVADGAIVDLNAAATAGSEFTGWSVAGGGSCPGTGGCAVTLSADRTVTAHFELAAVGPPGDPPKPSNAFSLGAVTLDKRKGTAKLEVAVPGPGQLALGGKNVKPQRPDAGPAARVGVGAAGTVTLKLKATGKAKRKLAEKGKAKLRATITYTPTGGDPATQTKDVKLKKRRG